MYVCVCVYVCLYACVCVCVCVQWGGTYNNKKQKKTTTNVSFNMQNNPYYTAKCKITLWYTLYNNVDVYNMITAVHTVQ